jgi:hypothetical protein
MSPEVSAAVLARALFTKPKFTVVEPGCLNPSSSAARFKLKNAVLDLIKLKLLSSIVEAYLKRRSCQAFAGCLKVAASGKSVSYRARKHLLSVMTRRH